MTDKLFYKLWKDAIAQPDEEQFIGGYGYPDFFDDISSDLDTVVLILPSRRRRTIFFLNSGV